MKKLLFLLTMLFAFSVNAQETVTHANRLYLTVGESKDRSQVPLTLYLENPTIALTAVEVYITLPGGTTLGNGTLSSRAATHSLVEGDVDGARFVSIASPALSAFTATDGELCTWQCNLSSLADGEYTISATGMFAVGVNNEEVTSYAVTDQSIELKIDETTTGVEKVEMRKEKGEIYNLRGIRLSEPQKSAINIINGKKAFIK